MGEMGAEGRIAGGMGTGVKHDVDSNIKSQEDSCLVRGVRDVTVDKDVEKVGDGVEATIDANAKWASRNEESSEVRAEVGE